MATLTKNTADSIEFTELHAGDNPKTPSFVIAQLGEWEIGGKNESGIVIDSSGPEVFPAVLSANNARKLAKWLVRAADTLDGASSSKPAKKRQHYEPDDDNNYGLRLDD